MASCMGCGNFYTPVNYENDNGICPSCYNAAQGYSYTNREWVCGDICGDIVFKNSEDSD